MSHAACPKCHGTGIAGIKRQGNYEATIICECRRPRPAVPAPETPKKRSRGSSNRQPARQERCFNEPEERE